MARLPRLAIAGLTHHVIQRGHNRQSVFLDDTDRLAYLTALREAAALQHVAVHAYVLMDDHVHLLVTPPTAASDTDATVKPFLKASRLANAGSPTQPRPSEASVMPSWQADR